MTEKDIDVNVSDDVLTISSERDDENEEKKKGYLLRERRMSSFSRSFVLPRNVDREHINAGIKNGILMLDLPKSESSRPKRIDVKAK